MWNVTGVTGAAPVWLEMMNWLYERRGFDTAPPAAPDGIIRAATFAPDPARSVDEYIVGTEPADLSDSATLTQPSILFPPDGAVFAEDDEIPVNNAKLAVLLSRADDRTLVTVDGQPLLGFGARRMWVLSPGSHTVELRVGGVLVDQAHFLVRSARRSAVHSPFEGVRS